MPLQNPGKEHVGMKPLITALPGQVHLAGAQVLQGLRLPQREARVNQP